MNFEGGSPVMQIAELEIEAEFVDEYRRLLSEEINASIEREPGVLMLQAVVLVEDPTKVRLLEVYADRGSYEAHLRTPHFLKYKTGTAHMVRSLRLIPVAPIATGLKQTLLGLH